MKVLLIEKEVVIHVVASSLARIILLDEAERVEVLCDIRISYVIIFYSWLKLMWN